MAALRRTLRVLRALLPDRIDVHLYGGALLMAVGAAMYFEPVGRGLIVFGMALLTFVYWRPE